MNITTINQLVSLNISIELDEALAALDNPSDLLDQLRKALGDVPPIALKKSNRPKGKRSVRGTTPHTTGPASTMTTCPECGKAVKR